MDVIQHDQALPTNRIVTGECNSDEKIGQIKRELTGIHPKLVPRSTKPCYMNHHVTGEHMAYSVGSYLNTYQSNSTFGEQEYSPPSLTDVRLHDTTPVSISHGLIPSGTICPDRSKNFSSNELESVLSRPQLEIMEQPKQRGMRFRYQCEGRSAGSILGESSNEQNKTLPAIEFLNCRGVKEIVVKVSLVMKDDPYKPHPHGLVGKDCHDGICEVHINPEKSTKHSFSNLGIQCVKKKDVEEALAQRRKLGIDPYNTGHCVNIQDTDMNVVRLCFETKYLDKHGRWEHLNPVLSEPVYDKKSTNTSELKISRMNKKMGPCNGGQEVYLLCDKVQKEDISVIFKKDNWEAKADFSQTDVHRQVAIVFKTPPYKDLNISSPETVEVFLKRIADRECSDPVEYTYLPIDIDSYHIQIKKRREKPDFLEDFADPHEINSKRKKKKPLYTDHLMPVNSYSTAKISSCSDEDRKQSSQEFDCSWTWNLPPVNTMPLREDVSETYLQSLNGMPGCLDLFPGNPQLNTSCTDFDLQYGMYDSTGMAINFSGTSYGSSCIPPEESVAMSQDRDHYEDIYVSNIKREYDQSCPSLAFNSSMSSFAQTQNPVGTLVAQSIEISVLDTDSNHNTFKSDQT
ncbi:transcription factor RelB-like [Protopterus annectens]|uniref:transcription factor RelB-like n=1 Tax=Protopterus annectens TaxID=7888 RepID=UPI001CF960CB|nr:transcription factor RelB-like [Protopterus annectens]